MPDVPLAAPDVAARAVEQLVSAGVDLHEGLRDDELAGVEARFGFAFNEVHRELLSRALPMGAGWPDWRAGAKRDLRTWLSRPIEGVLFDVLQNGFWPGSWGGPPANLRTAERVARNKLAKLPTLVPLHRHRFMAAAPAPVDSPVLSIHQTDVTYSGADLNEYLGHELLGDRTAVTAVPSGRRIPFWSDLAEGLV